jgi:hypothetical protein
MRRIAALAVALLAAGCATAGTAPGGAPEVHPTWDGCPESRSAPDGEAIDLPRLGDDFTPVAVTVCATGPRSAPAGGEDMVATEQRGADVEALVAALRLPDEERTDGACTLDLPIVPWFALHDAQGRWVRPGVPVDACGKPRIEVRDALAGLKLTTVTSRKVGEITSAAAAAAGCVQRWADMVSVEARDERTAPPPTGYAPAPDAAVRVCVYRVPPAEQSSGKPGGDFVAGGPLTPAEWAAIRTALPSGTPAARCDTPANRFAVLSVSAPGEVYVELDGCRRVLIADRGGLLQGTPELVGLLERAVRD